MTLVAVPASDIWRWWPRVSPMLIGPLSRIDDEDTLDDVREALEQEQSMLWLWVDQERVLMALVLRVQARWLLAWLVAGEQMEVWLDEVVRAMQRYAKEYGLAGCQAVARPGMAKTLRRRGWRSIAELVRLPNGRAG